MVYTKEQKEAIALECAVLEALKDEIRQNRHD